MWCRQIEWIEPIEAAARLADLPNLGLLDSAMRHPTLGRYSTLAADPFGLFLVRGGVAFWNGAAESTPPLEALRARLAACRCDSVSGLSPFQGGAIGAFAYEFGWTLEGRPPPTPSRGDEVRLAFHDVVVAFDHDAGACWLLASGLPAVSASDRRRRAATRLEAFAARLARPAPLDRRPAPRVDWRPTMSRENYRDAVERVKEFIRAGDIYQANVAQRFAATLPADTDPLLVYRLLRDSNPAPFAAYLDCGDRKILSSSPELFLRTRGRTVETRPIKGTARRAAEPEADRALAAALQASLKDRAENVMIVDLLRNDLSKVCTPASVEVPMLCGLESYAGLHHLVSVVTGEIAEGRDALDLVAAAFPGGSITGAPKLRAMEIIADIERMPRGIYCGALGAIGFDGDIALNIAIRTLIIEDGTLDLRTGGGITILSDAETEYEETLTKAARVFGAFAPAEAETAA